MTSKAARAAQKLEDNQLAVLVDVLESSKAEPIDQCVAKVSKKMHENHQFALTISAWCDSEEMTALVDGSLVEKLKKILKETADKAAGKGKGKKGKYARTHSQNENCMEDAQQHEVHYRRRGLRPRYPKAHSSHFVRGQKLLCER